MKSEERHQLLTNDLGVVTKKTAGFLEQHLGTLIAVIFGVLAFCAFGFIWNRSSNSGGAAGWTLLESAQNLDELGTVVDKFKGKPPAQWAQLQISEKTLQNALPLMFSNRDLALADLKRSREGFESLLLDKTVSAAIRERSLWGLALCLESACDGDTSKPIKAFERLMEDFPDSIFKPIAEERIAALKKSDAAEFYSWFSKEKPEPPEARPRDFAIDSVNLPSPDFSPKTPKDTQSPKDSTTENPDPVKDEPADPLKPATEKPAAEKPADPVKPSDVEKPASPDATKEGEKPTEKPKE